MATRDKRHEIMLAAEKLFKARRIHEITMDEVAHAAKVGKGTIYLYFRDKDDLFFQTVTSGFDEMCELLEKAGPGAASFDDQFMSACRQISDFFEHRRHLFKMIVAEEARMLLYAGTLGEKWRQKRQRLAAAVASIIRRGVEDGRVRPDIHPVLLANLLLGTLRTRHLELAEMPPRYQKLEVVADFFLHGAGCSPPPGHCADARRGRGRGRNVSAGSV
jgi:AcrR family transcriptional regulator